MTHQTSFLEKEADIFFHLEQAWLHLRKTVVKLPLSVAREHLLFLVDDEMSCSGVRHLNTIRWAMSNVITIATDGQLMDKLWPCLQETQTWLDAADEQLTDRGPENAEW